MIIVDIIALKYKFTASWIKYMLLGGLISISVFAFFICSVYAVYYVFVPIFVSTRYFNKKIIYSVSIITTSLFLVACILSVVLEPILPIINILHQNSTYNPWGNWIDALAFVMIPCVILLSFLTLFAVNLTKSGRKLIWEQVENNRKILAIDSEIAVAAQIQKSVLPKSKFVTSNNNFTLYAYETPAKEVCGDFYDYFMADENTMVIVVADVSDKGIPAAMFMMSAKKGHSMCP